MAGGETESPRGSCSLVTQFRWPSYTGGFSFRPRTSASRVASAVSPPPSGVRPRACLSKERLGRQRELGRPCPCRVRLLRGRGGVSQARSRRRFPRRSCSFCKVPLSSAASVGRLGPRNDETRPCPGGAPSSLRETVYKHDNSLSRGRGSAEVEFCLRKPKAQEGSQGCPSSRNKSGTEPLRVWIWKNHYWEGNSGVKMA